MATIEERIIADGTISYRAKIRLRGSPVITATFKRKSDAKRWLAKTESEIREGRHFKASEAKKHTLGEMVDRYIKDVIPRKPQNQTYLNNQVAQLQWWKDKLGDYLLSDMSAALIAEKRDELLREQTCRGKLRNPATVVRYMAALSHAFSMAVKEWGWLEDSPIRKVNKPKESKGRVRYLNDQERSTLLEVCRQHKNPFLYPIVVLALSTGMRQGEIMQLKWQDVDLNRNRITLHKTKNGDRRVVPLVGLAKELLSGLKLPNCLGEHLIFSSEIRGRRRLNESNDTTKPLYIRTAWESAIKAAGIKDFRFHDLRHSAASYLAMNGATITEIGEVLGHKTLQMVKRYSHLSDAHTSSVVEKMNLKLFG